MTEQTKTAGAGLHVEPGFAFWQHRTNGEIWAIRTDDGGTVIGSCGPLRRAECRFEDLPNYDFHTEDAAFIEARCGEFRLVEPNDLIA